MGRVIFYTSGTTGDPKGVVHAQRWLIGNDPGVLYLQNVKEHDFVAHTSQMNWIYTFSNGFLQSPDPVENLNWGTPARSLTKRGMKPLRTLDNDGDVADFTGERGSLKMKHPLEDITVLDLTRLGPGPFCTMVLSDWGARVLKVEQPGGGQRAMAERAAKGPVSVLEQRRHVTHDALGRNKRSIALNMKTEEGLDIFYELAKRADILVEGFRPGVVNRLGIDYESLTRFNSKLIYCSISGYGQTGPNRGLVGHDINYIALAGALSLVGEPEGKPRMPSNILGDFAAGGQQAVIGILLALLVRNQTGKGQYIDIAMTDGVFSLMADEVSRFFINGEVPSRGHTKYTGALPYYDVYETKDGEYISVGCNEPHFYANLCRALGLEEFIPYQYTEGRKRQKISHAFAQAFKSETRDFWFEFLKDKEVCVAPVNNLEEALNNRQLKARGMVVELEDPVLGRVKQVGIPIKLSATPGKIKSTSPQRGQHTREVLSELGYPVPRIDELITNQVVEETPFEDGPDKDALSSD